MKTLLEATKAFLHMNLKTKSDNITWWSSTFEMVRSFKQVYPFLHNVEFHGLDVLLPRSGDVKRLDFLLEYLYKHDWGTNYLHRDLEMLADARALFNCNVESFSETTSRLHEDASIILFTALNFSRQWSRSRNRDLEVCQSQNIHHLTV